MQKWILIGIFISLRIFQQVQGVSLQNDGLLTSKFPYGRETGDPFIKHYKKAEYKAHHQNFAISRDSHGIMYFGNTSGVLVYDGVGWELIGLPNQTAVKSLAFDKKNDRMYAGGRGDFGYLEADSSGALRFISMRSLLKSEDLNFLDIWDIYVTPDGIYFVADHTLFRWKDGKFKVWKTGKNFIVSYWANETLWVSISDKGLMKLQNEDLVAVHDGHFFADKQIYTILPYNKKQILIGTRDYGLFICGQKLHPFHTGIEVFLRKNHLYTGLLLNDSTYAFGTLQGGLMIMDKLGRERFKIDGESGLTSPTVFKLFQDDSGLLWAGLQNGIAKIEYPSPFSFFGESNGLYGGVRAMSRFKDKLYVGTDRGFYVLNINSLGKPVFQPANKLNQRIWGCLPVGNRLLIAAEEALYQLKGGAVQPIGELRSAILKRSKLDTNRVFVGLQDRISSIYLKNNKWQLEGNIKGIQDAIYDVLETPTGDLWLGTNQNRIYHILFKKDNKGQQFKNPEIEVFNSTEGVPDGVKQLYLIDDTPFVLSASNEMYYYNKVSARFLTDQTLNKKLGITKGKVLLRKVDDQGNIWFDLLNNTEKKIMVAWKLQSEKYKIQDLREARILNLIGGTGFFEPLDSILWYRGGEEGLIQHDLRLKENLTTQLNTLIRKVTFKNDSLLFAGYPTKLLYDTGVFLPFVKNSFRFAYTLSSFESPESNIYQYYLEGFDKGWSEWSSETSRDFTNLPEGKYRFRVQGKNLYGKLGKEAIYIFTVQPPWYRTWWAYTFYILIGIGIAGFIVGWRSSQLKKEKEKLEELVEERTHQLNVQAHQLAQQAQKLQEIDRQKSRFFVNISHEFRTPLTLIKGPVEQMKASPNETLSPANIEMIDRNADRLLRLVNQLLDLSRLDANTLRPILASGDISHFLHLVASTFTSYAEQREIHYHTFLPEQPQSFLFDQDKLEKIIYNLLSNAFKFTPDGGKVVLTCSILQNLLIIRVADSGIGIALHHQPYIFDRFYLIDDTTTRTQEGTGIGLSLVRELVSLLGGDIQMESYPAQGSTFTVQLPIELSDFDEKELMLISHTDLELAPKFYRNREEESTVTTQQSTNINDTEIILIVEDNADMRRFIRELLHSDYKILEAVDGQEGWIRTVSDVPDLIITDLMMPNTDGITLCHKLKTDERTSHIPVIMLTARAGQDYRLQGLETGADNYLTKPFDRRELQLTIKNLITQRNQMREKYRQTIWLEPQAIAVSSLDEQFLHKVKNLLEENISDAEFGVPQMQHALSMGKTQLHRKLKALTDQPPGEFLRHYRLKRAAQILEQRGDTTTQVAYAVGFNNLSYFAKCFKDLYGVSPSDYRQANK